MASSDDVIQLLLKLKDLTNDIHDRLHDQEHFWESLEYEKLEDVWDEANREVWDKLHHKFLRRIYELGGQPDGVTPDITTAYVNAMSGFQQIHDLCGKLCDAAHQSEDYVTKLLVMKSMKFVESWMAYIQAKQAQVKDLGAENFMTEQI